MNSKSIGSVVVVLLLVGGLYWFTRNSQDDAPYVAATNTPEALVSPSVVVTASPTPSSLPAASTGAQVSVKTFTVVGTSFAYEPKVITVRKGDSVKIVFTNSEGFHDWVIDEFSARTAKIPAGQTTTLEFVADKTGSFEYYCSVGSHRAQGMRGTLVVQ